jgi:hypothetical protein
MDWNGVSIAYAPYHNDLDAPGDRRRFVFYAKARKIKFEIADPLKIYDVVYLTYGCNLSIWLEYKKNNPDVKLIFELIDSYLFENIGVLTIFRGLVRYLLGRESTLWLDYKVALRKIISVSDAVVCSTQAQKNYMLCLNSNIHLSLDYFSDDITHHKTSLKSSNRFKLVWEGQAYTVKNLLSLNNTFKKLGDNIELYIITDPVIKSPFGFNTFDKKTNRLLRKIKCKHYFLEWNKGGFSEDIANADLAIIPISSNNPMMWNKPENKLLLLWEIGIPTLTSDTPSYKQVMDEAGLDMYCSSSHDWLLKIEEYISSTIEQRTVISKKASDYLNKFHNKAEILKKWDGVFDSLK